ncbi:MAG TPA: diaminobutyrate acetyltransferase [Devosiaceae bacterium]
MLQTVAADLERLRKTDRVTIRRPAASDGPAVWQLVKQSGSLDENSMYCNLLQCTHFAQTCAIAEIGGEVAGWLSGYIPPEEPDVLFVWQVCVSSRLRGQGIARRLVDDVLSRRVCSAVTSIHSTITLDNDPSWALFGSIAEGLDANLHSEPHFTTEKHFDGAHDTEHLVMIGPFASRNELRRVRAA